MICCAQVLLLAPSSYLKRAGREGGASRSLRRWGCAPCYARRGHRDSRGDIPLNQRRTNQGTKHRQTPDLLSQPREELTARRHSASGTANAGKWRQDLSEDSHPSISNFYRKVQSPGWLTGITLHNAYKIFQGLFFQPDNPAEARNLQSLLLRLSQSLHALPAPPSHRAVAKAGLRLARNYTMSLRSDAFKCKWEFQTCAKKSTSSSIALVV